MGIVPLPAAGRRWGRPAGGPIGGGIRADVPGGNMEGSNAAEMDGSGAVQTCAAGIEPGRDPEPVAANAILDVKAEANSPCRCQSLARDRIVPARSERDRRTA